jgi:hypothetical protein
MVLYESQIGAYLTTTFALPLLKSLSFFLFSSNLPATIIRLLGFSYYKSCEGT